MSNIPATLKYTKEHEWIKLEGTTATIGITEHAQSELGDIVFVELPAVGKDLKQNGEFGVVESVKTVSNLYSPVSGKVSAINDLLSSNPETINKDAYGNGWIIKVENFPAAELNNLLSAADYQKHIGA
jgi:glycine cleavage system H protein